MEITVTMRVTSRVFFDLSHFMVLREDNKSGKMWCSLGRAISKRDDGFKEDSLSTKVALIAAVQL